MARPTWRRRGRLLAEWTRTAMFRHGMLRPRQTRSDRKVILIFNTVFGAPPRTYELPPGFEVTHDLRRFHEADAVVFHIPALGNIDRVEKPDGQIWVAQWWECGQHPKFAKLNDRDFMARFDLTMSYRRDADVFLPYFN